MNSVTTTSEDSSVLTIRQPEKCDFVDKQQLESIASTFSRKIQELESVNKEACSTIDTLTNSIRLQNERQSAANERCNDLEKQLTIIKHENGELGKVQESKDKVTEEKFVAMQKLFKESQEQMQKQFQAQQSLINTLTNENNSRKTEISNLNTKTNSFNSTASSVSSLSSSLNSMYSEISGLKQREGARDTRLNTIEASAKGALQIAKLLKQQADDASEREHRARMNEYCG